MKHLDLKHLRNIVGDNPEFLVQVLEIFLKSAPRDLAGLHTGVGERDPEVIRFHAHKLKSACGAIGFNSAFDCFKRIEALARAGDPAGEIAAELSAADVLCASCIGDMPGTISELRQAGR
jgi:HPt (histidine-containing phosphotransfer) domain-containing protein